MDHQNVTLSLPKDVLQKVKLLAVKRGLSLSGLLVNYLEKIVLDEEAFTAARRRHLAVLETGLDLGTKGSIGWTREELHD
jgi:hypothetical protein